MAGLYERSTSNGPCAENRRAKLRRKRAGDRSLGRDFAAKAWGVSSRDFVHRGESGRGIDFLGNWLLAGTSAARLWPRSLYAMGRSNILRLYL